jgi:hypothetical protein
VDSARDFDDDGGVAEVRVTRRAWFRAVWVSAAFLAGACGESPGSREDELDAYCAVVRRSDLDAWVGDVVTLCTAEGESVSCSASRVSADGTLSPITTESPVTRVLPASGGRFVALLADERLVLLGASGAIERELAGWASDPWISDDGQRVAWVGLPEGVDAWDFGVPTVIATQEIDARGRTVVAEDDLAGAPRPIPGTDDVLYVSSQTGLASFWMAGPSLPPRQITNVGLSEIGQATVPVAGRQLAWSAGTLFYGVVGAEETSVWRLALGRNDAAELGPGAWPRVRADRSVLAMQPPGGAACASIYAPGGTP